MVKTILALAIYMAYGCGGGDPPELVASQCEQLRDHVVELRLSTASGIDVAAHRKALHDALGADFLQGCSKMSDSQVKCALASRDSAAAVSCSAR